MLSPMLLALVPLGVVLGVPAGWIKERFASKSPKRMALMLVPLMLAPLFPWQQAVALLVGHVTGRAVGASLVGVGLTGGIATGKSTVSKQFADAGAVIVDADVIAREVVLPGHGAYNEIVKVFGTDVLNDDQTINRAKLGAIIFSDPAKRSRLNACTHKYIIWTMFKQLVYNRFVLRKRLVVFDAPLLFETKFLEHFCYPTIVVACSEANELARLTQRDASSRDDAEKRIQSQMALHEKVQRADLVVHNDGSLDELIDRARETLQRTAELVGATKELTKTSLGATSVRTSSRAVLPSMQALFMRASQPAAAPFSTRTKDGLHLGHTTHVAMPVVMATRMRVAGFPLVMPRAMQPLQLPHLRNFASRRNHNPWQQQNDNDRDWVTVAKTGALVMLGAGALIASTSLAFGAFIAGAAGYGVYALYQRLFGRSRYTNSSNDPFASVRADVDRLMGHRSSSTTRQNAPHANDLDALVQNLPLVVRGLVKTLLSFVGGVMKRSMARVAELQSLANDRVESHARVRALCGDAVRIDAPPTQWVETSVNGVGKIDAVFPVTGSSSSHNAYVKVQATVDQRGAVSMRELKFHNVATREVIDLLRDDDGSRGSGPRKTIVDAEYVDI